ncbi:MAG: hypothetical protein FK734_17335 [Asgard group archaeon]|nr:hypothetical protein [Asgard group archaeon]
MRRIKIILIIILNSFFITGMSMNVQGSIEKEPLYSCESDLPKIDGYLNQTEWVNAKAITVKLYSIVNQFSSFNIEIMSLHNSTMVCFGVTVPDKNISTFDALIFCFRTNMDEELVSVVDGEINLGSNHDCKMTWAFFNNSLDDFTNGNWFNTYDDSVNGGTFDGLGRSDFNGTFVTFECLYPLDSGDRIGHDFQLAEKSAIEFIILYQNDLADPENPIPIGYSQMLVIDDDYEFQILYIGCPRQLPIPLVSIFSGLLVIPLINMIKKKKK